MPLTEELESLAEAVVPADIGRFRQHLDAAWIEEALVATGTATVRKRRLPADQVVWLVLGMALLRNESIERVVAMLDLALPSSSGRTPAKSTLTQARARLGEEPLEYLFDTTADRWAHESAARHRWRGLSLYGIDGTTLRVPDSPENWKAFGGQHGGGGGRNGSAYPTVRLLAVMALRSHLLAAARFADYSTGEVTLADQSWNEIPEDSLTITDRNFLVADDLTALQRSGNNKHWLVPAKSTTRTRRLIRLGHNDWLVEMELSQRVRDKYPDLPFIWLARAITYKRKGFPERTLLASLGNAELYPRDEIIGIRPG